MPQVLIPPTLLYLSPQIHAYLWNYSTTKQSPLQGRLREIFKRTLLGGIRHEMQGTGKLLRSHEVKNPSLERLRSGWTSRVRRKMTNFVFDVQESRENSGLIAFRRGYACEKGVEVDPLCYNCTQVWSARDEGSSPVFLCTFPLRIECWFLILWVMIECEWNSSKYVESVLLGCKFFLN